MNWSRQCVVVVCSGLTSLSAFFSHVTTVSGYDRELNAHYRQCVNVGNFLVCIEN